MHTNYQIILDRLVQSYAARQHDPGQRLYINLYNHIKSAIAVQDIPQEYILPSTRALALALGISRSTVIKAYELLRLEGYLTAKPGSGYSVKPVRTEAPTRKGGHPDQYPSMSETGLAFLKNVTLINTTSDKSIAFRPGLPPLDLFPVNTWKNLTNLYWRHIKASALSYSPSSGVESLKKNIANYLNITRNIKCDYRQVIIVSGSLQSLYLTGSVLINSGDEVIMENPTFPNVHSIFKSLRADILPVAVDEEGLRVKELPTQPQARAKLIHTTPSSHYPSGARMSLERRKALLAWAHSQQAFIIENDYEHEVCNWEHPIPSLFSLDTQDRVIYMGTFNRLLHPSIRLGYMVIPFYLLEAVEALQKHSHRFVSPSTQIVMNQFIEQKHLYNHVKRVVQVAAERKAVFEEAFQKHFQNTLHLQNSPSNSLFVVAKLEGLDDREVVNVLEKNNIMTHAYSKCYVQRPTTSGLIMGHTSVPTPVIKTTLSRMARIWKDQFSRNLP